MNVIGAALFVLAQAGAAAPSLPCGTARPHLDRIATAEGLVIAPDGTFYFSQPFVGPDQHFLGRYRPPYDAAPEPRWLDLGGDALGVTVDPARNVVYAGSRTRKQLLKVTLGEPPVLSVLAEAEAGINGLTLAADGAVYYTDQDSGHVFRVSPDGTKSRVTGAPLTEPNGLAFGPDGALYVVSWASPEVVRLELAQAAETGRRVFATLPQVKADGIAFDARGRLFVTASSTLYEISPDGRQVSDRGRSGGANVEFGVGLLSCSDVYVAGTGQGILRYAHDTPGRDVPWHRAPVPAPPQAAFPGQYASSPAAWRFPAAPSGCSRFAGEEKIACLEFVSFDFGQLSRYAEANRALGVARAGEARVVFIGDSITDGWSSAAAGGFFPGKPYVNRGISSQTTGQMLLRYRADVLALRPQVVVILAGTNDVAGNAGPVTPEQVQDNLATMAELARVHGIRVVLASILPVSDDTRDGAGQPLIQTARRPPAVLRALNVWMADYARRNGHVFLDYAAAMTDGSGALRAELSDDGLHPNAAGYAVMAPLAEQAIEVARRSR